MKIVILIGILLICGTIAVKPTNTAFKQLTSKHYVLSCRLSIGDSLPVRYETYESLGIELPEPMPYGCVHPSYFYE